LLEGRVAIVTGAGRGTGRAIAAALVAEGARVIVADNGTSIDGEHADPSVAREAATALGKAALAFTDSVASPGAARQLVEMAVKAFGGLDIVVNNAAIRRDAPVFGDDGGDWDAVIRNNLSAAFYLVNAASPVMRKQVDAARGGSGRYDWGRIVNIVAPAGLFGTAGQVAHASAQAGLLALTRVAALDLADDRVTANVVAPFADTDTNDVARLVTALCSPAAKDITGQALGVRSAEVVLFSPPQTITCVDIGPSLAENLSSTLSDKLAGLKAFACEKLI
jgi:NAD(P)-dependent dehydrogenase (short-subunit alcohol dehydrogenase family)